jgi:(p)ppGpp synthase/HD superfamily hydrolase
LTESDVASAVLHDVLEDDPAMSRERLAAEFGADVAEAVFRLSRKTPEGTLTPAEYRRTLLDSSRKVQVIKLCDRLDNILSLYSCPDLAKVQRYLDQTAEFYGPLGAKANLPDLTRSILEEVEQLRGPAPGR